MKNYEQSKLYYLISGIMENDTLSVLIFKEVEDILQNHGFDTYSYDYQDDEFWNNVDEEDIEETEQELESYLTTLAESLNGILMLSDPDIEDKMSPIDESLTEDTEDIDLSEYDYITSRYDGGKHYSIYRKIVDDKGVWAAVEDNPLTNKVGTPFRITYDQARGFEEIDNTSSISKLRKDLGKMLLPPIGYGYNESLTEDADEDEEDDDFVLNGNKKYVVSAYDFEFDDIRTDDFEEAIKEWFKKSQKFRGGVVAILAKDNDSAKELIDYCFDNPEIIADLHSKYNNGYKLSWLFDLIKKNHDKSSEIISWEYDQVDPFSFG